MQPPFQGPPIPTGVNPQQWQAGFWQYNPAYNYQRAQQQQQQHVPWIPSRHRSVPAQQRQQHQQQQPSSHSYNPYKRVPRPPSAEYLASRLSDNPLGLSNMIPAEELYEQSQSSPEEFHTPWVWNPAELDYDKNRSSSSSRPTQLKRNATDAVIGTSQQQQQQQQQSSLQSHNPYKRVPPPPSAEYLASRLSDNPLGLSNMIPAEELYEQSQSSPEEFHTPWIWNPAELDYDKDESSTSSRPVQQKRNATDPAIGTSQQQQQQQSSSQRAQQRQQQYVPWIPSRHWGVPAQQRQQHQQQQPSSQSHNPYKRVPRPPSAEYLASRLSDNPLGLSNMIPVEELDEQSQSSPEESHTPWIWNPAELAYDTDESFKSFRPAQLKRNATDAAIGTSQ